MKRWLLKPVLILVLVHSPAPAQMLPVTTTSEAARGQFLLGRTAAHHYQFAEAIEHLDQAIAADPSFVLAHLHRAGSASTLAELEDYLGRAEANRDGVSEGEKQMIDAFRAFLLDHDYERAVEIFGSLALAYPDDPYLSSYLGLRYYRNLRRYDAAAEQFRRAVERDPTFVQAYNWLGYIAMDQQDYATAEHYFRSYLSLAPEEPRPHNSLGVLYLRQGRHDEAAHHFERASAVDPRFTESRDNLVRVRIAQSNQSFQEAFNRGDPAGAATRVYTREAQALPPGGEKVRGRENIVELWASLGEQVDRVQLAQADLEILGDTAYEIGHATLTRPNGSDVQAKYVVIWKQEDGLWKWHVDIWNLDG